MTTLFISHSSKDNDWADRLHAALRTGGFDCLFLDNHPDDGIHAGADWEQELYRKLRQGQGLVALCTGDWLASPWCVAEVMLARERGKPAFLIATAEAEASNRIPEFLKTRQLLSLAAMTEAVAHERLLASLRRAGLDKLDFALPDRPYPGLAAFGEADAAVFFGRDDAGAAVDRILQRARRSNEPSFVLVLGASGAGKSSLVQAGVLPSKTRAMRQEPAAAEWWCLPPVFAGGGFGELTARLAHAFREAGAAKTLADMQDALATPPKLCQLARELLLAAGAGNARLLIVLDQLEEVFGTEPGSEARRMLRLVLDASATPGSPVVVLATMRSDFLDAFQQFEGAGGHYAPVTLDPMPRARFAEVIEGPAGRFGLSLGPGLAERMAEDTGTADALPLLAYTLERLYEKRDRVRNTLTRAAYDELGGVEGSVKHVANAILDETGCRDLPSGDKRMRDLRRAFFSLAEVALEGQFTRRAASWSTLKDLACADVLERFVEQRLITSHTQNGERQLAVTHEALFRVWDQLNQSLTNDRRALLLRSQIVEAAREWEAQGRPDNRLWDEARVLEAVRVIDRSGVWLDDLKPEELRSVRSFLGPTGHAELEALPGLDETQDADAGSGRYGEAWALPLGHKARLSVGVRLAELGDRRKGVGLREEDGLPDIDWVLVPGGEVKIEIREQDNDPDSPVDGTETRTVSPFEVSCYPITLAQFQRFLAAREADLRWRLPPEILDQKYGPPKPRVRHGNHPVDSVSWIDACAFCRWLSERLGETIRLPTEFEWQQAATGGDASLVFPWGSEWDPAAEPWRANTLEAGLYQSTAAGMYPKGTNRLGLFDMSGTLWEWCLNKFDDVDEHAIDWANLDQEQYVSRVLRGGSWLLNLDYACVHFRYGTSSSGRNVNVGFRVVRPAPA